MDADKQKAFASVVSTLFKGADSKTDNCEGMDNTLVANLKTLGYNKIGHGAYSAVFSCNHADNVVMKVGTDVRGDGYLKYAIYCLLNRRPEVPIIHSVHVFDNAYVVFMERLSAPYRSDVRDLHIALINSEAARTIQQALGRFSDFHDENFMMRGDQAVITDPYSWCKSTEWYCEIQEGSYTTDSLRGIEHDRKLAKTGESIATRQEEKDRALWEQPKHDNNEPAKRLVRLLSQMQIARIREEDLARIFSGPVRACRYREDRYFALTGGFDLRVEKGRPYIHSVFGVVVEGRDFRKLEEALQDWVEQAIRPRRHTHLRGHRPDRIIGDTVQAHPFIRPRSQVRTQDEHAKQLRADINQQVRVTPHGGFSKPCAQILYRHNRGCTQRDQGGAMGAIRYAFRHVDWGQAIDFVRRTVV